VRFKLDENLPVELLDDLRVAGHEADGLHDEGLIEAPDSVVLDLVRRENRVLLTLDKGIADVRTYPPEVHAGIVLFRPPAVGRGSTLLFVRRHLASLFERELTGRLLVITDRGIRLR
jgi:hypothetical protein